MSHSPFYHRTFSPHQVPPVLRVGHRSRTGLGAYRAETLLSHRQGTATRCPLWRAGCGGGAQYFGERLLLPYRWPDPVWQVGLSLVLPYGMQPNCNTGKDEAQQ